MTRNQKGQWRSTGCPVAVLHETQRDSGTLLDTLLVNYKRPKETVTLYWLPCWSITINPKIQWCSTGYPSSQLKETHSGIDALLAALPVNYKRPTETVMINWLPCLSITRDPQRKSRFTGYPASQLQETQRDSDALLAAMLVNLLPLLPLEE